MADTLITVSDLSKKFCRDLKRSLWYGMQDIGREILGSGYERNSHLREEEFWAVNNVSFQLRRGECLGLIGRNGAGKTTLLKLLNGLIKPDKGQIVLRGSVGALIALGAGFHPVLTGRENIYVNASVLGLSKTEIDKQIQEIIDFAELREFIDMPVQSYSSGMVVRLGFAIATSITPDILLLDEVLAVGDVAFQVKCYSRIAELKDRCAVIFVSHSMNSVARMSDRILLLQNGNPSTFDRVQDGIVKYYESNWSDSTDIQGLKVSTGELALDAVQIQVCNTESNSTQLTTKVEAKLKVCARADVTFVLTFTFRNMSGQSVAECPSPRTAEPIRMLGGEIRILTLVLSPVPLATGSYLCSIYALDPQCVHHYLAWVDFERIYVAGDTRFTAPIQLFGSWENTKVTDGA